MTVYRAADGTRWAAAPLGEDSWTGWQPGEDGVWLRNDAEMRATYPEVVEEASERDS